MHLSDLPSLRIPSSICRMKWTKCVTCSWKNWKSWMRNCHCLSSVSMTVNRNNWVSFQVPCCFGLSYWYFHMHDFLSWVERQSNLGTLKDDIEYDKELLAKQREEVAMLKEQLNEQVNECGALEFHSCFQLWTLSFPWWPFCVIISSVFPFFPIPQTSQVEHLLEEKLKQKEEQWQDRVNHLSKDHERQLHQVICVAVLIE